MSDSVANLGFAVDSKPLDDATQKLGKVTEAAKKTEDQAKKTGSSVDGLTQSFSKAGSSAQPLAQGVTAANTALGAHATAVNNASNAHAGFSTQSMAAFHSVRSLSEALVAGQSPIQALAQQFNHLSYAASGPGGLTGAFSSLGSMIGPRGLIALGIGGLALGLTALAIPLARVGDEVFRSQKFFEGLTGSSKSGAIALDAVKTAAHSAGIETDAMTGAIQKAAQGQAVFANKSIIYANTADQAGKNVAKLADGFGTLGKIMQNAGATFEEEKGVFNTLGDSIQKTGGLTADAFQKIRDISPATAREIANIFGERDIEQFQQQLAQTPKTLDDLLDALKRVKPQVDAALDTTPHKTFSQATREMSIAWEELLQSLAKTGVFSAVTSAVSGLAKIVANFPAIAKNSPIGSLASDVANVAGFLANGASGQSGGFGNAGNTDALGNVNPYADTGPSLSDTTDGGAFASGGSFVVGGSGGTDSQTVTFKATPGEVVTVATPDQAASAIASLTPTTSSTSIDDLLKEQTKEIVDAINGLKPTGQQVVTAASPIIVSGGFGGGGGYTSGRSITGSGGGGAGSSSPFRDLENAERKRDQELAARERELGTPAQGLQNSGVARGLGAMVMGSSPREIGVPIGQYAALNPNYGPAVNPNIMPGSPLYYNNNGSFDYMPFDLSQMGASSFDESGFIGSNLSAYNPDNYSGSQGGYDPFGGDFFGGYGPSGGSVFDDSYFNSSDFADSIGSFATGGQFTVGGDGGIDTTPVKFLATRGERVTITPPGITVPSSMRNPAANDNSGFQRGSTVNHSTKNVNIYVQQGITAETVLRSRAQIARAM